MTKKLVTLIVISLFTLTLVLSAVPAMGATGDWITEYTVRDLSTNEIIIQSVGGVVTTDTLLQGVSVKVTMTITVPMTVPDSTLTLTTSLQKASGQDKYWELTTTDYPVDNYNPNSQTVSFDQKAGEIIISCYGTIPTGLTTSSSGSTELHIPKAFTLIALTGPNNQALDQIKPWVIDAKIDEYNGLNAQSNQTLHQLIADGAAGAYVQLYENVINGAFAAAQVGYIDNAISQLNQLAVTEPPPVEGTSSMADTLFIPLVGALAAIAVIGLVLFLKARGKSSYVSQVVEDQIRDLEGLTLRASKVDKSLGAGLETIEERLKRAVGA